MISEKLYEEKAINILQIMAEENEERYLRKAANISRISWRQAAGQQRKKSMKDMTVKMRPSVINESSLTEAEEAVQAMTSANYDD